MCSLLREGWSDMFEPEMECVQVASSDSPTRGMRGTPFFAKPSKDYALNYISKFQLITLN
jgi:hypothetical protein